MHTSLLIIVGLITTCSRIGHGQEVEATWLAAPNGFRVTQYADDALATNIYSMTTDRLGRIVVAGPGYIKILIDENRDGRADRAKLFSKYPVNGAQGLCFDGTDLLCVGDEGLLRFTDNDQDNVADGPPELIMKLQTGGEHDSHAIRKGPDGYWYLISGNYSKVNATIISSNRSPITQPSAGLITRWSPDFQSREVIADGFRNAYDFDFDSRGDLYVYDSDGERDISLPWYQPTRVFRVHPGGHAGWVTRNWKRPDEFIDVPTVAARLGRGSPTGVACYRHRQFPQTYQNAVFVLDWTFGRVIAISESGKTGTQYQNELFLQGKGTHGFAPTDVCVGRDGSLYVSVGGRSTAGSVYRIRFEENEKQKTAADRSLKTVSDCLDLPQPNSAWSRFQTESVAKKLGRSAFEKAIFDESLTQSHRLRAVEMITSVLGGLSPDAASQIPTVKNVAIQARLAWSICQEPVSKIETKLLLHFVNHPAAQVQTASFESLIGNQKLPIALAPSVDRALRSKNRRLRQSAIFLVSSCKFQPSKHLKQQSQDEQISLGEWIATLLRKPGHHSKALKAALERLESSSDESELLDILRFIQLSLGDVGPGKGIPSVFESYHPQGGGETGEFNSASIAKIHRLCLHSNDAIQKEAIRVYAMAGLATDKSAKLLLRTIGLQSTLDHDLHVMTAIAFSEANGPNNRNKLTECILALQEKIEKNKLNQDRNWEPRVKEILIGLKKNDPELGTAIADAGLKSEGHIFLMDLIPRNRRTQVIDGLAKRLLALPDYQISTDLVRLLGSSTRADHLNLIRQSFDNLNLRDTIIEFLGRDPQESDRSKFVSGLRSPQPKTIQISAKSLLKMPPSRDATEQLALFNCLQKLNPDREGYTTREWIVRVLQRNMKKSFGFQFGPNGYQPQIAVHNNWKNLLTLKFPEQMKISANSKPYNSSSFREKLNTISWEKGMPENGKRLFLSLSCGKCHGKRNRLGPDLAGVTKRFSKTDLFQSIVDPSYQVPSRYQSTLFETSSGQVITGIVIYNSVDGVIIRDSNNQTVRLEAAEILRQQKVSRSLMPDRLLENLSSTEYADLFSYLQSL